VVKDIRGNCIAGYGIEYRILNRILQDVFGKKLVKLKNIIKQKGDLE